MKRSKKPRSPDLQGLSQLNRDSYAIRVQVRDPLRSKRNVKRTFSGVDLSRALQARDAIRDAIRAGEPIPRWVEELAGTTTAEPKQELASTTTTTLPTLGDFVEQWLARKKARGDLEESTAERYATALDHLSPRLLRTCLDEITEDMIENWMVASTKKFAPATINGWLRVLRTALNKAGLNVNPAEKVELLTVRPNLEQPNALRPHDLRALLDAIEQVDALLATAAWVLAITGLRWGEVSALKWGDIDESAGVIWIRRKVVLGELVPSTKTNKRRVVGAPKALVVRLRAHRDRLEAMEHPGRESGLVFPSWKGTPLGTSRMSEVLREARTLAGIEERFTSHGFRRSATDLLRQGAVDPAIAAALIGHETERMREHYSTIRPEEATEASERVAALLATG